MAATPLIRTPNIRGGTFYAFSSASRDLSKAFNNENLKFVFSKYVCLDIPNISKLDLGTFSNFNNYVQFDTIDGAIFNGIDADHNINLAESLQNYALNLESSLLSDDDHDPLLTRSIAERVFFKWMKEVGAIRFREADATEVSASVAETRFVEENQKVSGTEQYSQVVKHVGDIDIVNHVSKAGETFTEIYLHVPTDVGATPTVLFDAISDTNYRPDLIATGDNEFISGRNSSDIHPEGLDLKSFYDYDSSVSYTDPDAAWHGQPPSGGITDSYFTEPVTFDDATNLDIQKFPVDFGSPAGFAGTAFRRSKLDGISVDFDSDSYFDIVNDPSISTIQQYNSVDKAANFEFNAVLVYYDFFDVSNPSDKGTNLYGILFLDNVTPTVDGGFIERFQKFRPNPVTKLNGNSFGLKVNVRFDASISTGGVDTLVNEYNTFSMGLFVDASTKLQEATLLFEQERADLNDALIRISAIENNLFTIDSVQALELRMSSLETSLNNAQLALSDTSSILDLIAANSDEIQNIVTGNISLDLQYNTDVVQAGEGIVIDRSVVNKIKVVNKNQEYVIPVLFDGNGTIITETVPLDLNTVIPEINYDLEEFTNMVRIYTENTALGDFKIFIDDSTVRFKKGQTIRFVFPTELDLGTKNIEFFTDAADAFGFGELNKTIGVVDSVNILSNKPIIELICLDEGTYDFTVDVLR